MSEVVIVKEYGSSILNYLIIPLIGASVVLMDIIPFLIAEGFNLSPGMWVFTLLMILVGLVIITYPFTYKLLVTEDNIIHKRLWGEKGIMLHGVTQVGEVEQRVMNGAPIAINKVRLIKADGSSFQLSLRNLGKDQGENRFQYP